VQPVGRIPKWCSASCRQRAWEQSRAEASGLAAVRVVERLVVEPVAPPKHDGWAAMLAELTRQLDTGQLYRRDLPALAAALDQVLHAYRRATR
jgi:hypothetical protein